MTAGDPRPPAQPMPLRVRAFVAAFVVVMVGHSLLWVTPADDVWAPALKMRAYPPVPWMMSDGPAERAGLADFARFFVPWPHTETRALVTGPGDAARFAVAWVSSRLDFIGTVVGVYQSWNMFSPDVSDTIPIPRARLRFANGMSRTVLLSTEPASLTRFLRLGGAKVNFAHLRASGRGDARRGLVRVLARQFAVSESGSPLESIELYLVTYRAPAPGVDPRRAWGAQQGPPPAQVEPPAWRYDPTSGRLTLLPAPGESNE